MSSMVKATSVAAIAAALLAGGVAAHAQTQTIGRSELVARSPSNMEQVVDVWERLSASADYRFSDYANFLLTYPDFPDEARLRSYAEGRLAEAAADRALMVRFFDRYEPLTPEGQAQFALALALAQDRPAEALEWARQAWRGGKLSEDAEAAIRANFAGRFTTADHDARTDALLWERDTTAAARVIGLTSPARRTLFMARMASAQGEDHEASGVEVDAGALRDPGYLYNRVRQLRKDGRVREAVLLLADREPLASIPAQQDKWLEELLFVARMASPSSAYRIAANTDDAFAPDTDISQQSYSIRDDYTSLMWLGGTKALWEMDFPAGAAPLFFRYGDAAKTPQTRSKGFYWAGLAAEYAGNQADARRYYGLAADYPEYFYGLLARDKLGLPMPNLAGAPLVAPTAEQRSAFYGDALTMAVRALASTGHKWQTKRKFYSAIADRAQSEAELALVAELARQLYLPELAVVVGRTGHEKGFLGFSETAFPTVEVPGGSDWTMVHAIARQESEFDDYRISHAGARGFMQLMPGTAREQAGKEGIQYMSASLLTDTQYNIRLGNGYFRRMLAYYDGSYPLAVAAYNAGPGNVNRWLRNNGDPRTGGIDWLTWIERIPIFETKNYVQRVLENAVVYEAMHPERATYGQQRSVGTFLR